MFTFDIVPFLSVTTLGPQGGGWGLGQEGCSALAQFRDNAQLLTGEIFGGDFAWAAEALAGSDLWTMCFHPQNAESFPFRADHLTH